MDAPVFTSCGEPWPCWRRALVDGAETLDAERLPGGVGGGDPHVLALHVLVRLVENFTLLREGGCLSGLGAKSPSAR